MSKASTSAAGLSRGDRRLLHDLFVTGCALEGDRVPAAERVERLIGEDVRRALSLTLATTTTRAA